MQIPKSNWGRVFVLIAETIQSPLLPTSQTTVHANFPIPCSAEQSRQTQLLRVQVLDTFLWQRQFSWLEASLDGVVVADMADRMFHGHWFIWFHHRNQISSGTEKSVPTFGIPLAITISFTPTGIIYRTAYNRSRPAWSSAIIMSSTNALHSASFPTRVQSPVHLQPQWKAYVARSGILGTRLRISAMAWRSFRSHEIQRPLLRLLGRRCAFFRTLNKIGTFLKLSKEDDHSNNLLRASITFNQALVITPSVLLGQS